MQSIQQVFRRNICMGTGFSPPLNYQHVYERILVNLDYRLEVFLDFGERNLNAPHGDVLALFSKANQRKWGFICIKRGCRECDNLLQDVNTWELLEGVRNTIISQIEWRSGEEALEYLHEVSPTALSSTLNLPNYNIFLQQVNRAMIT